MSEIMSDCADETSCEVPEMRRWAYSGFGDRRGSYVRTAVDISIQHHILVSFEISFMPDATLLVYFGPK